jgi:hypothetical protein
MGMADRLRDSLATLRRGPKGVIGAPGADSVDPVTKLIGGVPPLELARNLYGRYPAFWGRYFPARGPAEYDRAESALLAAAAVRVLPIARPKERVLTGEAKGTEHARGNLDRFFEAFAADELAASGQHVLFMFLDVEHGYTFDEAYYHGWSRELRTYSRSESNGKVTVLPCMYSSKAAVHWETLSSAIAEGAQCCGAWVARYLHSDCVCTPVPEWDSKRIDVPAPVPVLAWQYEQGCHSHRSAKGMCIGGFDNNAVNPTLEQRLLDHLVAPAEPLVA